ncbi:hypothetical protein [Leptolyngbya sp. GGD]|uniref:hypothetical protein n=1 Tax=Leptolyngbya sp. GGD TaxID=2997907 RepID=UPI00227BB211|nr:hypothetical protein [Leptolyngbya sp. GGD]MCY6493929.1 hypothetical protein [Leptolyngbya sp. GGD]
MDFIAFFQYENFTVLQDALHLLQKRTSSEVWVQARESKINLTTVPSHPEILSLIDDRFLCPQEWIAYSEKSSNSTSLLPIKLPLLNGTSIKDVNDLFRFLAQQFKWCVFTWGGVESLLMLCFLTSDSYFLDSFSDCYTQSIQSKTAYAASNILISKYSVSQKFSHAIRVLLLDLAFEDLGPRIWQACDCELSPPWIVTSQVFSELGEFREVCDLSFFVEGSGSRQMRRRHLKIIEPQNIQSFSKICSVSYSNYNNTTIAIPSDVNLANLELILSRTELYDCDNHDLQWVDEITSYFAWFYGISRDYRDSQYSLFMSKDPSLIERVDSLELDDSYKLISCF